MLDTEEALEGGGILTAEPLPGRLPRCKIAGGRDEGEEGKGEEGCHLQTGEEGGAACAGVVHDQALRESCLCFSFALGFLSDFFSGIPRLTVRLWVSGVEDVDFVLCSPKRVGRLGPSA